LAGFMLLPRPAQACHPGCCAAVTALHEETREIIRNEHDHLRIEVFGISAGILTFPDRPVAENNVDRLKYHERWLLDVFFDRYILPALMMMTEQLATVMMEQMFVVGTFFDAQQQMQTQRLFQELTARA